MNLEFLVKNGVQFGHQSWRVSPKMMPYIWGEKNGIHLIDVSKTATHIEKASQFLEGVAARGEPILWVGTKKAAQPVIEQAAQQLGSPYVSNRWIGGTLTNYSEVKKAILKLKHYEALLAEPEKQYTKKEYGRFRKIVDRIEENVGGIRDITWPIGALVVVDAKKEHVAVKEAEKAGVPVVALTDTNTDPSGIDYIIPGNDDISRAVRVVIDPLVEAVSRGMEKAEKAAAEQKQAEQQQQQEKASTQEKAQQEEATQHAEPQQEQASEASAQEQEASAAEEQKTQQAATSTAKSATQSKQSQKSGSQTSQAKSAQSTQKQSTSSAAQKSQSTKSTSSSTSSGQKKSQQSSTTSSEKQTTSQSKSSTQSTAKKSTASSGSQSKTTQAKSSQTKSTQQKSTSSRKSTTAEQKQSEATGEGEPVTPEGDASTE